MKLVSEGAAKNRSVRAGGYMILMQEQDSFGKLLFSCACVLRRLSFDK